MFSTIKMKITCAVFALVLLSMTAAGLTVNLNNEKVLKKTIFTEQATLLNTAANQIDERIFDALVDLYDTADVITPDMLASPAQAQRFLDSRKAQQVFYDNSLFLLSRSGKLLATSPANLGLVGKDYSFRDYFKQTVQTGKILVSPPIRSTQNKNKILIVFTSPVYDRKGEIIAVLGGSVNIEKQRYLQTLRTLKLGRTGYLSLYDNRGTVIMHPSSRTLQASSAPESLVRRALSGHQGTEEVAAEDGTRVIRSVRKLQSTDWVLAVSYPLAEAYAPLYAARKYLLLCGIIAALLSALSAWHLVKTLLAQLLSFTRHLERFRADGAPVPFPVASEDEIGVMAHAFNGMISETGRRASELRELKDFAENLVLNSSLPTFVLDLRHTVLYWNKACERLTGVAAADVVGTTGHRRAVYGDERTCVADALLDGDFESLRTQHPVCGPSELVPEGRHCEGWYLLKGGERRYLIVDAAPIYNHQGELIAAIETIQDYTEMEEAADKIEQLSRVIEQCPYAVVVAGLDGAIEYANPTIHEITGLPAEQVVGRNLLSLQPYDLDSAAADAMRQAIAQGTEWQGEIVRRRSDGKLSWEHLSLSRITNRNGAATHLVAIFRDINTRKEADRALRESEARHREMFENNPQPMWVFDVETLAFLAVNNAAVQHYGYSREEFLSMTMKEILPGDEVQPLLSHLARGRDRISEDGVWRHLKKDRSIILVRIASHPMQVAGRGAEMVLVHDVTAKKLVEDELRRSEERYRNIFDGVGDMIYSIGLDSCFVSLNRAFEDITGWLRVGWLGRSFKDLVFPEDLPRVERVCRSCQEGAPVRKFECRIRTAYGQVVYLEIDATPHLEHGEVVYVKGIARNVTERKLAQQKQEYLQRRLSAMWNIARMVDAGPEALQEMVLREITSMTQSRRGFFASVDQTKNSITIQSWSEAGGDGCMGPCTFPLEESGVLGKTVASRSSMIVNRYGAADGSNWIRFPDCSAGISRIIAVPILMEYSVVAVYAVTDKETDYTDVDAEHMNSFLKNVQIILEKRRAEESLMKLSHAIAQSPVSVVITDAEANIEFVNPRFTELTGYHPAEVLGKNPRMLGLGQTPREEMEKLWSTITAGKVWNGVFRNRKKNGEPLWELATISPIKNKENRITHYIGIKEDMTERMQLEEQLRQSQKMEALGTLTGGIAHDFNNILTAISAYCSLLERLTADDSKARRYLGKVMESTARASALTKSLLAYSRKQPLNKQVTDLNRVVRHVDRLLSPLIGEDIEFRIIPAHQPMTVLADSHQVEQVLINLATNARDAMPDGGVLKIEVDQVCTGEVGEKLPSFLPPGSYARLRVSDTGTGIDPKTMERIFEPFFTTKEVDKGTGLGLSIVYGIVKQHNGFIDVSSELSKGAVFSIYLPATEQTVEQSAPEASPADGAGHGTILLVEDDQEIRSSLKELLEANGYRVLEASDGEDGIQKYREHRQEVELVILDLVMPRKHGKMAYEELRGIDPGVKVLFISGYASEMLSAKGFFNDDINFISKPIAIQPLLLKIKEVLGHGK